MISYDIKEPVPADFSTPIRNYIQEFYQEDPDSYKNELQQLHLLNSSILNVTRDNQGCITYRKYFAQLQFLQSRFPMSVGGTAAVSFTWYDVYTGDPIVQKDIRFEQACVLFNLGGLYSQLGANEQRSTDESMKIACTYFQCAAGAFQYLKENFNFDLPDLGSDILKLKSMIMLSQAQECLLEKSIRDNRKNTLIARISMQIKEYYQEAVKLLESSGTSEMGSQLRKSWTKHLQMKINMYSATTYVYMSNEADSEHKFGEKVAYLKAATERINEAFKISKNQPEQVLETLKFLRDVVGNKFEAAVKENDFVYHELVPELDKLPEIKGVSLVKAVPFQYNDPSISGPDIFQRLIPMRAHEASSLYSEEKASLLRTITAEIEEKDLRLSESLTSMHIDDLINPVDESLPESLVVKCKELRESDDVVSKTAEQIKELAMLSEEFEAIFNDFSTKLKSIEEYEREAKVGDCEGGVSAELEGLKKEFIQCNDANEKARDTNMTLCSHFEENREVIEFLQGPDDHILASLPSQNFIDAPSDEPVVQRIRELLGAIEKMKMQRKDFEKQLREELSKDDVTSLLVIKEDGNQEEFFKNQLAKHDAKLAMIRQNLAAQDNILTQLTEANAKYAGTRMAALEVAKKREDKVQMFLGHATLFLEVKSKLSHGLAFYNDLRDTLKKLEKKVNDFYQKREKEKAEFLAKKVKDAPPARPTAAKPMFDRASKPKATKGGMPPMVQDGPFPPHSQTFPPIHPQNINMQRPNLPSTTPIGQIQKVPPGPRMMAPSSVPNSSLSTLPSLGPQQHQIPSNLMQPLQLPQQRHPQPSQQLQPHPQLQPSQHPQQQQQPQLPPPAQPQIRPQPQQLEYRPQQQQHQPNQQPQMSAEVSNRFKAPDGPFAQFHAGPQGGELNPQLLTTGGNTPFTNRFSTAGQPMSTHQSVSTSVPLPQQNMPSQQNMQPRIAQQGPQQVPQQGLQQGPQQGPQQVASQGPQQVPQQGPHQGPQQVPPQGPHQGPQQGPPPGLPHRPLQGNLPRLPPQGQQPPHLQGIRHQLPQEQSQLPLRGFQQGMQRIPTQMPHQGGPMHPHMPGQSTPLPGPAASLPGGLPPRATGQVRGMIAPVQNQPPIQMDKASQQFPPFEQHSMQQPHMYSQQNIRNPYPQQSQFSGPRGFPVAGMDSRSLVSQGQMQQPTESNATVMQQEFRPQFQPIQRVDQWQNRPQQGQRPLNPGHFRPQAPIQTLQQDSRFVQEIPRPDSQTRFIQPAGPHNSFVNKRNSSQDFVTQAQGIQRPLLQSQPIQQQGSADSHIQYPGVQQQYQPGLRLPEPLLPERAVPQNLLDTANADAVDRPLDLQPTLVSCEASAVFNKDPGTQAMNTLNINQNSNAISDSGRILQRPDNQDQVENPVTSPSQGGSNQDPSYFPSEQMHGAILLPNEVSNFGGSVNQISHPGNPQMTQHLAGSRMVLGSNSLGGSQAKNFNPVAPARSHYALQGPMSSPVPEANAPVSVRMEMEQISMPPSNPGFSQPINNLTSLQPDCSPTAPPVSMFSQPPPFSPNRPFDPITMNNKPVMATVHSPDPIVSSILGVDRVNQQKDMMQMGFQQFQIQQMIMQQQQLISMIQSQQSQQKATESSHMEQLQKQILEQQKIIERLTEDQRKMSEQQQQAVKASQSQSQENLRKQMEYQQAQMREQQEQLAMQNSLLMQLQNAKSSLAQLTTQDKGTSDVIHNVNRTAFSHASKVETVDPEKAATADSGILLSNESNSSNRTTSELNTVSEHSEILPSKQEPHSSKETSEPFSSKAKLVASSIMSAFDLSDQAGVDQDLPKQSEHPMRTKPCETMTLPQGSGILASASTASEASHETVVTSQEENLKFDLDQFEEEMHAVLSGSQKNELKTPTKKELNEAGTMPSNFNALQSGISNNILQSEDDKLKTNEVGDAMNNSCATLENTPPFYEPMLDIEQRSKQLGVTNDATHEQEGETLNSENVLKDSSTVESSAFEGSALENLEKFTVENKQTDVLDGAGVAALSTPDVPNSGPNIEIQNGDISSSLKLPDYPSINRDTTIDSVDSHQDLDILDNDTVSLSEADLDILLPNVPSSVSPIPQISTPDGEIDESPLPSPSRPQLNRQEGRLSFYQAAESEEERKAYLEDLDAAVEHMHQQCMQFCKKVPDMMIDGFTRLWDDLAQIEELDSCSFFADAGKNNSNKNRYRDILPWDHTRVRLKTLPDDYINASHINNLTPCSPKYIASQGPIPQSFVDFWTMVWEQHCVVIVMLTNEVEGTKLKCHPYWPRKLDQTTEYGELLVSLREQEAGPSWKCRIFLMTHKQTEESRTVKHLQFTSWPDYGIPNTPYDLLAFNEEVRNCHKALDPDLFSPLLLHCSAGVGRTGTFACVYSASEEIMGGNGLVEIPGLIRKLRQCRFHMVQRKEQLVFCYQAILCFAQQFLAEEQMRQERQLQSASETSENVPEVNSRINLQVSEPSSHTHSSVVASGKKESEDTIASLNSVGVEDAQIEQKKDENIVEHALDESIDGAVAANSVSNYQIQSDRIDEPEASTSSRLLHLELDHDGCLDEKHTGQERDNIPKFKVKSDIFASKSPPVSPGFSPPMPDDKAP